MDNLLLQPPAGPSRRRQDPRRHRRPGQAGPYVFKTPDDAVDAAKALGQDDIAVDPMFADRKTTLKAHKDGRLVMEIERKKGDAEQNDPEGWLAKKTKWIRVFETTVSDAREDDLGLTEYDNLIRAIETSAKQFVGWVVYKGGEWIGHPATNVKMLLQSLGNAKDAAECVMGRRSARGGGWSASPSAKSIPAAVNGTWMPPNSATNPPSWKRTKRRCIPHWDLVFEHIGIELTPALRGLPWAQQANIKTGADYLRAWVACASAIPSSRPRICSCGATRTAARASSTRRWNCW